MARFILNLHASLTFCLHSPIRPPALSAALHGECCEIDWIFSFYNPIEIPHFSASLREGVSGVCVYLTLFESIFIVILLSNLHSLRSVVNQLAVCIYISKTALHFERYYSFNMLYFIFV